MSFPSLSFKVYNNIIIPAKTRIFVQYGRYGNREVLLSQFAIELHLI